MISLLSNMDISPQNKENSIFKIRMGKFIHWCRRIVVPRIFYLLHYSMIFPSDWFGYLSWIGFLEWTKHKINFAISPLPYQRGLGMMENDCWKWWGFPWKWTMNGIYFVWSASQTSKFWRDYLLKPTVFFK